MTTAGVVGVVGFGRASAPIPDHEIAVIGTVLKSGLVSGPCSYLPAGQRIRIEEDALAGLERVVVKSRKPVWRLVVSVTLLQPSVAVEIDREWARAIK